MWTCQWICNIQDHVSSWDNWLLNWNV